jgi:sulfide:quinone oxidoreductase
LKLRLSRNGFSGRTDAPRNPNADPGEVPRDGKRLVLIAGGGVAALEAMIALRQTAGDLIDVELVSPDRDFYYRPLSVGEPFGVGDVLRFDLPSLARGCGASHLLGSLTSVDADSHQIRTSRNAILDYDDLLITIGARPREAVPGALTFRGEVDVPLIRGLLDDIDRGLVQRAAFALPSGATWPLPLYELALLTAHHAQESRADLEITIATPEERPLGLLGHEASDAVASQLKEHGIQFLPMTHPDAYVDGELRIVPGPPLQVDAVVALPRLRGVPLAGVPQDDDYFIPVDATCRVRGLDYVFAAGDITTFPVKQGGLAAQQADVAATEIAAAAGADVVPERFQPVLRGLLLSGSPLFLRAELGGGHGPASVADSEALWWPAAKIASRFLSPYLAEHAGLAYGSRGEPGSLL